MDNPFSPRSSVLKQKRTLDNSTAADTSAFTYELPPQSSMPGFKRRMTGTMQDSSNDDQMQMESDTADQIHAFDPSMPTYYNESTEQQFFAGTTFVPSSMLEAQHKRPIHKLSTSSFSSNPYAAPSSSLNSPAASTFSNSESNSYATYSTAGDLEHNFPTFQQDSPDHTIDEDTEPSSFFTTTQSKGSSGTWQHPCNSGMDEASLRRYYDSYNGNGYGDMQMYDDNDDMEDDDHMAGRYMGNQGSGDSYAAKLEGVMGHV